MAHHPGVIFLLLDHCASEWSDLSGSLNLPEIEIIIARDNTEILEILKENQNPVLIESSSPEESARAAENLLNYFPEITVGVFSASSLGQTLEVTPFITFPKTHNRSEIKLIVQQVCALSKLKKKQRDREVQLENATRVAEETVVAFMRSHQDLASLVHFGQDLQECSDKDECCRKIIATLKELGLNCQVLFPEDKSKKQEILEKSLDISGHFQVDGNRARLYFVQGEYAGYIDAEAEPGSQFDRERFSDILHLFKNQLVAFLERLSRMEEREKMLQGYRSILDSLESMVIESDFGEKTQRVRQGIETDTEGIFDLLDRIRSRAPEEVLPWIDEIEIKLQFADKVSQQINHMATVLRDLINILNPSLASVVDAQEQVSSAGICDQRPASQDDIDSLFESLGGSN